MRSSGTPPANAFSKEPEIARALSLYNLCQSLNCLPDEGGLLDQSAEWVTYVGVFMAAENEYLKTQPHTPKRR